MLSRVYSFIFNKAIKHNQNGDLIEKSSGEQYTYDIQGNLTSIVGNGTDQSFTYNGNGNRLSKTVDGETTYFVNDLNRRYEQVLQTYDADGIIDIYTYGLQRINSEGQNNETYLYDGRDSVAGAVDNSYEFLSYSYTAYGELMPNSPTPKVFGYNAEATDYTTGLQYLRARYYSTDIQRFVQKDDYRGKFTRPSSMNRYIYTEGNPVTGIDPSGYGVIDDYNYQTKQKSNVMQSFREAEKKSVKPKSVGNAVSNFYTDYYTKKANTPTIIHNTAEYYQYVYGKQNQPTIINYNGKVMIKNPYPYGPDWVSEEAYNCMKDLENGKEIDLEDKEMEILMNSKEFIEIANEAWVYIMNESLHYDTIADYEENGKRSEMYMPLKNYLDKKFDENGALRAPEDVDAFIAEVLKNGAKGTELNTYALAYFRPDYMDQEDEIGVDDIIRNKMSKESAQKMYDMYSELYESGSYYEDISISANFIIGDSVGTTLVINLDDGYVEQYVHMGFEVGTPGASIKIASGTIEGLDEKGKLAEFSVSYTFSAVASHEASVSVFNKSYGDVTQVGNGIQSSVGASLDLEYYTHVVSYDFD